MRTESVCFVVEGEFITQMARTWWNDEGAPDRALDLLHTLDGISDEQCLDILEGRSKLVGNSSDGVTITPDKSGGRSLKDIIVSLKRERDDAVDEREDMVQLMIGDTVNLASPTGLREVPRRKTKHLIKSGRFVLLDDYEFDDLPRERGHKKLRIWKQLSRDIGSPGRAEAVILDRIEEDEKPRSPPPSFDKITNHTGWLTPQGKFYPCNYGQHRQTAEDAGFKEGDESYVRCAWHMDEQWFFGESQLFTPIQIELVSQYCIEKNIEGPWWLKDLDEAKNLVPPKESPED